MKQTAVEWLVEQLKDSGIPLLKEELEIINQAKEMENIEKLKRQLFTGKVAEIIGNEKTIELLKECNQTFKSE